MFDDNYITLYVPSGLDFNCHVPDSYNCKIKVYPDGSKNCCLHQNDVFGGDPYSSSRKVLSDFSAKRADFHKVFKEEYERSNVVFYSDDLGYPLSLQTMIDDNIRLMDFGRISAAECVRRNLLLYQHYRNFKNYNPFKTDIKKPSLDPRSDSLKRAKDSIFDYIVCNDWTYFLRVQLIHKKWIVINLLNVLNLLKYGLIICNSDTEYLIFVSLNYIKKGYTYAWITPRR